MSNDFQGFNSSYGSPTAVQLLQQILSLQQQQATRQNTAYQSIITRNTQSLQGLGQNAISDALGGVLPIGGGLSGMVSGLIGNFAMGRPYSATGTALNPMSGYVWNSGGSTFSGAIMQEQQNAILRGQSSIIRTQTMPQMRRKAFQKAYKVWDPSANQAQLKAGVDNWMQNPVSAPNILNYMFDPANLQATTQAISATMSRVRGYGKYTNDAGGYAQAAKRMQQMMRQQVDSGTGYGGFATEAVAGFMSTMAAARDPFSGVDKNDPKKLQAAVQKFRDTAKEYLTALMPLRDVFGNDIPAMISTISGMTGQRLGNISVNTARTLATSMTDTMRITGVSRGTIQQTADQFRGQMGRAGAGTLTQLGAFGVGLQHLTMSSGRLNPMGVTAQGYANMVGSKMVSSAASQSVRDMAYAYGLWNDNNGGNKSVQEFISSVGNGGIAKAMELAGVANRQQLMGGAGTAGAWKAMETGAFASFGFRQQKRARLRQIAYSALGSPQIMQRIGGQTGLAAALSILNSDQGGSIVSGPSDKMQERLLLYGKAKNEAQAKQMANSLRYIGARHQDLFTYVAAQANGRIAQAKAKGIGNMRRLFSGQDQQNSAMFDQVLNAIGQAGVDANGNLQLGQRGQALALAATGLTDKKEARQALLALKNRFGDRAGLFLKEMTMGKMSNNAAAQQAMATMIQNRARSTPEQIKAFNQASDKVMLLGILGDKQAAQYDQMIKDPTKLSGGFQQFLNGMKAGGMTQKDASTARTLMRAQKFSRLSAQQTYMADLTDANKKAYSDAVEKIRAAGADPRGLEAQIQAAAGGNKVVAQRLRMVAKDTQRGAGASLQGVLGDLGIAVKLLIRLLQGNKDNSSQNASKTMKT